MLTIWIIHRHAHQRAALARIAGSADNTVLGGPDDKLFESAAAPDVVVLGLSEDFETELEFTHRMGRRLDGCSWIVLASDPDLGEARRLFDTLPAEFVRFPPSATTLRDPIRAALRRRGADPLSRRRKRDALARRFARWFADQETADLLRCLDPRMARVPLLVLGEPGTGRSLLVRYVHAYGGGRYDGFVRISCRDQYSAEDLLAQLASADTGPRKASWTLWLEDLDELPRPLQHRVCDWVEYGLPEGHLRASSIRWVATADDRAQPGPLHRESPIEPDLALALSGIQVRIPPLRERTGCVEAFALDTALAWGSEQGRPTREFSRDALQVLRDYPWSGNLRELDAVIVRTLSATGASPILPAHLCFEGVEARLDLSDEAGRQPEAEASLPEAEIVTETEAQLLPDPEIVSEAALPEAEIVTETEAGVPPGAALPEGVPEAHTTPEAEWLPEAEVLPELEEAIDLLDLTSDPADEAPESTPKVPLPEPAPSEALPQLLKSSSHTEPNWPRIVRTVAHEIRNPLVSIRTFSELLPEHFDDPEFRERFSALVGDDVRRIDEVVSRLQHLADAPEPKAERVDVAAILERLLEERRPEVHARRLLVLEELDRDHPDALANATQLRGALGGLLSKAFSLVPDHGDVYIASKHSATGLRGQPSIRILLRYNRRTGAADVSADGGIPLEGMALDESSLEAVVVEKVVAAHSGALTIDSSDSHDTVIVIDLPAPDDAFDPA